MQLGWDPQTFFDPYPKHKIQPNGPQTTKRIGSGIYSSNVLIFFPSENLPAPNLGHFSGKIEHF